jgi:hypothetical protein
VFRRSEAIPIRLIVGRKVFGFVAKGRLPLITLQWKFSNLVRSAQREAGGSSATVAFIFFILSLGPSGKTVN